MPERVYDYAVCVQVKSDITGPEFYVVPVRTPDQYVSANGPMWSPDAGEKNDALSRVIEHINANGGDVMEVKVLYVARLLKPVA